jgi:hypothetical protein
MKCPNCKEELKKGSIICPNCGNKIEEIKEEKTGYAYGLILGCSAIISALVVLCIKTELSPGKFFSIYFIAFVIVFLCVNIIYLIFRK